MTARRISGADIDVAALAAIRATREASVNPERRDAGVHRRHPAAGGRERRQHATSTARPKPPIFPGDLPAQDPRAALDGSLEGTLNSCASAHRTKGWRYPHIRLDRAIEFLLGDRFA